MGFPTFSDDEWRDRALTAEQDIDLIRSDIREFQEWLAAPDRGPVIFRSEVTEKLDEILCV